MNQSQEEYLGCEAGDCPSECAEDHPGRGRRARGRRAEDDTRFGHRV